MRFNKKTFSIFFAFLILLNTHANALAEEARPRPRLRVLTLNVFAGVREMDFNRLAKQIEAVKKLNPDVIALQEVFDPRVRDIYEKTFADYYAFNSGKAELRPNFFRRLVRLIEGFVRFTHRVLGLHPWSDGAIKLMHGDSHGLMLLLNKNKGVVHPETKFVKMYDVQAANSPLTRLFEAAKPKAFLWVEYLVNGVRFLIINSHLSNGVQNDRRVGQLAELSEIIAARDLTTSTGVHGSGGGCSAVFCGDTNSDARQPEMEWWHSNETGFQDTLLMANPDQASKAVTWDRKNPLTKGFLDEPDQRMDFISVRNGPKHQFRVISSSVVLDDAPVSDHYGVLTELEAVPKCEAMLIGASAL